MGENELTKTLTFGLGTMFGFDKAKGGLITLDDESRKKTYETLRNCFYDFAKLCNYTTSLYYAQRILRSDLKQMGYSTGYSEILEKMNLDTPLSSQVLNQAYTLANAHFHGEHGKGLMGRGDRVLSTHKANGTHPIYFHKSGSELKIIEDKYYICYDVFSRKWASANGLPWWIAFEIKIKPRDKTGKGQLDKVLEGSWQKGSVQIARNERLGGRKYLARISVKYTPDPYKILSDETIMGIDLGVNVPAVIHFRINGEPLNWEIAIGRGRDMLMARRIVSGEIKRIVQGLRKKDSLVTGPARRAASEKLKELRKQERRIMKTASQRIAAAIADQAKRNGAGVWQMEALDKSIKVERPFLARYWAPGMLVDAIKWQASQLNVKLSFINPYKTSQRCSKCGHIDKMNRPKGKKKASYFECVSCGYKNDADKNAARNISTVGIENIISSKMLEMNQAL